MACNLVFRSVQVVSLGWCALQSHVVPCRLRTTCSKASNFCLPPPAVQNFRSCIVVHLHAVVRQDIFVSCLYQNYFVLAVDTQFTTLNYSLQKLMIVLSHMWQLQHKAPLVARQPSTENLFLFPARTLWGLFLDDEWQVMATAWGYFSHCIKP